MDSETLRVIRSEITRQLNIILSGSTGQASETSEDIEELFPGMPTITQRPVMHPYGISSAAPQGTISVVARQGDDRANRVVLGHRDKDRPSCQQGEVVLYNQYTSIMELRKGGLEIRRNGVSLIETQIRLLTTIINARTNTILGPEPLIPDPIGIPMRETFVDVRDDLIKLKGDI